MAFNIFQNPTKTLPKKDDQIIHVPWEQFDLGGRTSHIPSSRKADNLTIQHVPNAGTKT
jgi:hypothetical protein